MGTLPQPPRVGAGSHCLARGGRRADADARPSRRAPWAARALGWASLAVIAGGCEDERSVVVGRGEILLERREQRHVGTVEVVAAEGLAVTVVAAPPAATPNGPADGGAPEPGATDTIVWVEGPANLARYVQSRVVGDTLRISVDPGVRLSPAPTVEVHVAALEAVHAAGSGTVRVECLAGLGSLELRAEDSVRIDGRGEVDELHLDLSGSADAHLFGLVAEAARVRHSGSGDGWLRVVGHLDVELAGRGDLFIDGDPSVAARVRGPGEILEASARDD